LASGLAWGGLARGSFARGGVGAGTACTTDPPLVVTSSIRTSLVPGLKLPSIFRSVPWSFICLRTTPLAGHHASC